MYRITIKGRLDNYNDYITACRTHPMKGAKLKGWMYNHFFGEDVEPEDVEAIGNIFDNAELLEV